MQRRRVREHRHGQRLGGGAGRAGRHAPQLHVQRPLQDGVAQLELRRTPCLQAQPPRSQRLVQLAGVRAAVGMQYIVQLASEYFGDRAQMPALAHAVDAHDVPPAIQQADEVRERSEEHTSELQSQSNLVCRLLLEKKKNALNPPTIALTHPPPTNL